MRCTLTWKGVLLLGACLMPGISFTVSIHAQERATPMNFKLLQRWLKGHQAAVAFSEQPAFERNILTSPDQPDVRIFSSSNPQTENSIAVNLFNNSEMFISTNGQISSTIQTWFFSTNSGANWSGSETSPNSVANFGDPVALYDLAGAAYFVTLGSPSGVLVMRTTNRGATWGSAANADPLNSAYDDKEHAMTDLSGVTPNNIYAAWTDFVCDGCQPVVVVTRSTNSGSTWSARTQFNIGGDIGQGVNLAVGPAGQVYLVCANYAGGFLPESGIRFAKSTDAGATWSALNVAFAISGIRTSGGGQAEFNNTRVNSFPSMAVDRSGGSRNGSIYVVYADRSTGDADIYLRRSTDAGTTWSAAIRVNSDPAGKQQWFSSVSVDQSNGDVWVGYYDMDGTGFLTSRYLAHSSDGGTTWDRTRVSDVQFTPQSLPPPFAAGYMGDYYETGSHGGRAWATWSDNRSGQFQAYLSKLIVDVLSLQPANVTGGRTLLYEGMNAISTGSSTFTATSSSNVTFHVVNTNTAGVDLLPGFSASAVGAAGQTFRAYIGSGGSAAIVADGQNAAGEDPKGSRAVAREVGLLANYPNPFNPTTSISYVLANDGNVVLNVYDVLGREVGSLIHEYQPAGLHTVRFDAGNLPSGIYYYHLHAGSVESVKKMLLVK